MGVAVTPQEFHYVFFDAAAIADVAVALLEQLGMSDRELCIEVDETTPIARLRSGSAIRWSFEPRAAPSRTRSARGT